MKIIITLLMCASFAVGQEAAQVYEIPFASKGNTIELAIANTSDLSTEGVNVELKNDFEGLKFAKRIIALPTLKSKEERMITFSFDVEKTAKVNTEQILNFAISDRSGQEWKKEIRIKILAPTTYELFQNYPNPFNPTTTIEYQLPGVGIQYMVSLKVYDVLGREVAQLVNEQQEPGAHQAVFDARYYASGMYIYRLIAADEQNNQHIYQKRMMFLK
jgi:hypothetical protein